jgi:Uma2 family endonuclease
MMSGGGHPMPRTDTYLLPPAAPSVGDADDPRLPLIWEDEDPDMGESNIHVLTDEVLHVCLQALLAPRTDLQVFSNLNLRYLRVDEPDSANPPYVSPDLMVVRPTVPLPVDLASYRMRRHGPAPLLVGEILSERSFQQRDLTDKVSLYADLGVAEYVTVDVTGRFLPERLLLRRLQPDRTWSVVQGPDGGVTSQLGFRLVVEADGLLRVIDATTGQPLPRPHEIRQVTAARQAAETRADDLERRLRELEAELARLRQSPPTQ